MTTPLTRPVRRELEIDGEPYTLVVSAEGIRLTPKRFRSGLAMSWRALWQQHEREEAAGDRGRERGARGS